MPRYVTVGFDKDADAERFIQLVKGNGNLISIYQRPKGDEGAKVNNIQARGVHIWTPYPHEARRFEIAGAVIEFRNEQAAQLFIAAVHAFMTNTEGGPDSVKALDFGMECLKLLDPKAISGVRLEQGE